MVWDPRRVDSSQFTAKEKREDYTESTEAEAQRAQRNEKPDKS
jgi:hypothetical protein